MTISPCSYCGSRTTYVCAQARGPAEHHFDKEGQFIETEHGQLNFHPSQTVRCADCGKIRRDLHMTSGRSVVEEVTDE